MSVRNTTARWGAVSQLLHWLIVAALAAQVSLGLAGAMLPIGIGSGTRAPGWEIA